MHDTPKRPNITLLTKLIIRQLLRTSIINLISFHCCQAFFPRFRYHLRNSIITQFDSPIRRHKNITSFNLPVDYSVTVQLRHCLASLHEYGENDYFWEEFVVFFYLFDLTIDIPGQYGFHNNDQNVLFVSFEFKVFQVADNRCFFTADENL